MLLVTRAGWGARPPRSTSAITGDRGHAIHYEGPKMGDFPHESCAAKVRGIQNFHMDGRGWADIAYNALVCPHGYVFEGRGKGRRSAAQGTNDGNAHYYALCYLGGAGDPFTEAGKQAYIDGFAWLGGGPEKRPHSFFHATACPGDLIRGWINAGLPAPGGQPQPQPPSGGHTHGRPLVQVNVSPLDGKVHGAVWHPEANRWFWQRNYSEVYGEVAMMQQHLIAKGFGVGPSGADGKGGTNTRNALVAFQRSRGLHDDAKCGDLTWAALDA